MTSTRVKSTTEGYYMLIGSSFSMELM